MVVRREGINMSQLLRKPMIWAWGFVLLWGTHSAYTAAVGHWIGLVISLSGLVAALLVVSAIQSRRRKYLYPNHSVDDTLSESSN